MRAAAHVYGDIIALVQRARDSELGKAHERVARPFEKRREELWYVNHLISDDY